MNMYDGSKVNHRSIEYYTWGPLKEQRSCARLNDPTNCVGTNKREGSRGITRTGEQRP